MGMHICALDRPWLESSFGIEPFTIDSASCLHRLRAGCEFVYIDTQDTDDTGAVAAGQPRVTFDRPELELDMLRHYAQPCTGCTRYPDQTTLEQEVIHARVAYTRMHEASAAVIHDARCGRTPGAEALREALAPVVDSVLRNPDALLWLSQEQNDRTQLATHSARICILALAFGRHLGMDPGELEALGLGALLHDIGMTRLPQAIADGANSDVSDRQLRMRHVDYGLSILSGATDVPDIAIEFVRDHHANHDGSGYPRGLIGANISTTGRLAAIVHFFDRLTRWNNPGGALPGHLALKLLYHNRGTRLDPPLVDEFVRCVGIYPLGSVVELLTGEIGVVLAMNRERRLRPRVALTPLHARNLDKVPTALDLDTLLHVPATECEIARLADEQIYNQIRPLDYIPLSR